MTELSPEQEPTEAERRDAYAAQCKALGLKPWQEPPCVQDPDTPLRGTEDEAKCMMILRRMLAAGISRWHPDPLAALAAAKRRRTEDPGPPAP